MKKIKFDKRRKTDISREELNNLYLERKLTFNQLARHFNCTKNTISYWLRRYNIKLRNPSQTMKLFVNKPSKISKEDLYRLFIVEKLTPQEIAKKHNCKFDTIVRKLRKYKLTNKFSKGKRIEISKEELKKLYLEKKLTTYDIAEKLGCCQASVWKKLKFYNIKRRGAHSFEYFKIPSKKLLEELYIKKGLSTWEIERRYKFSRSTIYRHLKKYGLIRSRAEAHRIYPRKDFDGDILKKAYLIGFRIGDLRVRKNWEKSETLQVDSGSTKLSQIRLVRKLFGSYSHVWISKPNGSGKVQIQAHLNLSFSFLLSKIVPDWIFKDKENFFSFFAGFTDAEGCISVNGRDQAYYSLGNYDRELLSRIRSRLIKYGIPCRKLSIAYKKGKKTFGHYHCNADYYGLSINKKDSLLKLIKFIKPYLQHEDKINSLKLAENNIIKRNNKNG